MEITARTVAAAEPRDREYILWDDKLAGFGLRVFPTGRKAFIVQYRVGGYRGAPQRRYTIRNRDSRTPITATEARKEARAMLNAAGLGQDPVANRRPKDGEALTVSEALDRWAKEAAHINRRTGARRKPASVKGDISRLEIHIRPLIGSTRLRDLTADKLRGVRRDIAAGKTAIRRKTKPRGVSHATGGDGTAVQTLRIFASVLAYAEEKGWLDSNPARQLKLPASQARDRFLSSAEMKALGETLDKMEAAGTHPHAINIVRLLALTGARRGEIEALKWQEVDFERGALVLRDTKAGRTAFPLSRPALELLGSLPRIDRSEWVFPANRGDGHYRGLGKVWPDIRARAKLDGLRLHDLRHSFASVGAAGGIGLPIVGKLLGHRQAATTSRYAHIADDPLRAAADRVGGVIAARMGMSKPKAVGDG